MRFPILKALSFPDMMENDFPRVDFSAVKNLSFTEPDTGRFPALEVAFAALRAGGTVPAVLNASNEKAVKLFLDGKIKFTDIVRIVKKVIEKHSRIDKPSLEDIIASEGWAVKEVSNFC